MLNKESEENSRKMALDVLTHHLSKLMRQQAVGHRQYQVKSGHFFVVLVERDEQAHRKISFLFLQRRMPQVSTESTLHVLQQHRRTHLQMRLGYADLII